MEPQRLTLRYTTIRTTDLARARHFYEDVVGLQRAAESADQYVQLYAGGSQLCVDRRSASDEPLVVFAVADPPLLKAQLNAAGVRIVEEGDDGYWFVAEDPDGNLLAFERDDGETKVAT